MRERNDFDAQLIEWKQEETQPFVGWDFSYLSGRYIAEDPPWSYENMVRELLLASRSVLDLGTGGGEKLLELKDVLPPHTVATEGYHPNYLLAQERLGPLGVEMVETNASLHQELPFEDEAFDLVISRHTAFNIAEVERVLTPNGIFLTQQVDGNNLSDLTEAFDGNPLWPFYTLDFILDTIKEATSLEVERAEVWAGESKFKDVGAVVYFVKAVPWNGVEGFSVERYQKHLEKLQQRLEEEGELLFRQKLFMVKARKS